MTFKQAHSGNYQKGRTQPIEYIVVHYTANTGDTAQNNLDYFFRTKTGTSAHYFVDENEVCQSVQDTDVAWHCGSKNPRHPYCRNANSIGIEMCNSVGGVPEAVRDRTAAFVRQKMKEYGLDVNHVLRHYDVTGKKCLPTDKTELLTKSGWTLLKDIKKGDIVAQYDSVKDKIVFGPVLDVVDPYISDTICCRGLEATENHHMYAKPNCQNSKNYRVLEYGDILLGSRQYIVKNGAVYNGRGMDLTENELRLLVWIQGDGHYMKSRIGKLCGLEFHLKKKRKIDRITHILDECGISYIVCNKSDGTTSIRNYGTETIEWCEQFLSDKKFTYNFLEMSTDQFDVFWNEILIVDGCEKSNLYSSVKQENLDVVQAVCATKGIRTNKCKLGKSYDDSLIRSDSNYSIGGPKKTVSSRITEVSCVTVGTGFILIRQGGKTFIVGNCPAPWVDNPAEWMEFKKMLKGDEEEVTQDQFNSMMETYLSQRNAKPADDWAKPYIQEAIDAGAMSEVGGSIASPKGFITRQEVAVVAAALSKK